MACLWVSTHSRPKAAEPIPDARVNVLPVSTHSRPKAAGGRLRVRLSSLTFQHTAARRRLVWCFFCPTVNMRFQHTAARRRLLYGNYFFYDLHWFQHTAARRRLPRLPLPPIRQTCFNTQPPEGGCSNIYSLRLCRPVSTHSRPKAAGSIITVTGEVMCFNTQPPEGG